jgi:predicted transcriptional regulator
MGTTVSIEIDTRTADVLQTRAAELGITVPQLIAELATLGGAPREPEADEVAELDRRYARATEGARVPHERVVQWLRTWGTPEFRPWPGQ